MTLEDIVERTDPELIKIFNIKNNTRNAKPLNGTFSQNLKKPGRTLNK